MKRILGFLAAVALLLAHAQAQTSPAQMGITPTTVPEVLQVLDNTQTWVPIGKVDSGAHLFGILGTTTNNNATAGSIGEYVNVDQMTNVSLVNNTAKNITSISLTAGDWDVQGNIAIAFSGANGTAVVGCVSTVSATLPSTTDLGCFYLGVSSISVGAFPTGAIRVSIASTTTIYLVAQANFSTGTCNGQGSMRARRAR